MKGYAPFIADLRRLVAAGPTTPDFVLRADHAVNGEASARLVKLVSAYRLKRTGAFFTSSELSERAAKTVPRRLAAATGWIVDPACGAGNLLLAAAKKLPVAPGLTATLTAWGQQLAGFDLHQDFVRATHLRLAVLAQSRGAILDLPPHRPLASFFPRIRRSDGLRAMRKLSPITHLIVNPPFASVIAPRRCRWAKGRVTKAAFFFERCLELLPPGAVVSAILPDVLRSGSRYQRWRETMETLAEMRSVRTLGNFQTADVDVFHLQMRRLGAEPPRRRLKGIWWTKRAQQQTVGDYFAVHVGPVVPHRLKPAEGPVSEYLHAKHLPHWGEYKAGSEKVAFAGRHFKPPFVVVRRTSSPNDRFRALGTLILGARPVAVENHLLICLPKVGGAAECRQLLTQLRDPRVNQFINHRIRCRHLTVGVMRDIPFVKPK